jgi:hypothetical protein
MKDNFPTRRTKVAEAEAIGIQAKEAGCGDARKQSIALSSKIFKPRKKMIIQDNTGSLSESPCSGAAQTPNFNNNFACIF